MRFDYDNRAQSEGREICDKCELPMLGVGEYKWDDIDFCDCAEVTDSQKPREFWIVRYLNAMHSCHDDSGSALYAYNEARKPRDLIHVIEKKSYDELVEYIGKCRDKRMELAKENGKLKARVKELEEICSDMLAVHKGHGNFANVIVTMEVAERLLKKAEDT